MRDTYGLSDVWAPSPPSATRRDGLHFSGQDGVLVELVDPESGDPWGSSPARQESSSSRTSRARRRRCCGSAPRLAGILGLECPCGRTGFRFRVAGRSDDMFRVRVNVFPSSLEGCFASAASTASPSFSSASPSSAVRGARRGVDGREGLAEAVKARLGVRRPGRHASPLRGKVEAALPPLRRRGAAGVSVHVRGRARPSGSAGRGRSG